MQSPYIFKWIIGNADAHTHNQLQKMTPEQQAVFVTKLQKQRQLQLAKQMQGAGGHILIRGILFTFLSVGGYFGGFR